MKFGTIYEFLKDIGALAGLGWLLRSAYIAFANRLTRRERELLVAALASEDQSVLVLNIPAVGGMWVRAGKLDLGDSCAPAAEFVDALESLVGRGHFRQSNGDRYELTGRGIKAARRVGRRMKIGEIPSEQNSAQKAPCQP